MLLGCLFLFLPFEHFSQTAAQLLERGAPIRAYIDELNSVVDGLGHKILKTGEFKYEVRVSWSARGSWKIK